MNALLQALLESLKGFAEKTIGVVVPILVDWFKKHVLGNSPRLQALSEVEMKAEARAWVSGLLTEIGQAMVAKGFIPSLFMPLLPPIEQVLANAINAALDSAGV